MAVGATTICVPRTGPTCGSIVLYVLLLTLQLSVTGDPAVTLIGLAVKLLMVGEGPVGTLAGV